MFEKAVNAGRNHRSILAVALIVLAGSSPARAADVTQVALGSRIDAVVAGPDGGAWINIRRQHGGAIGHADAQNRFRTAATPDTQYGAALGPDRASAWFVDGIDGLTRADTAGEITLVDTDVDELAGFAVASGPDNNLW